MDFFFQIAAANVAVFILLIFTGQVIAREIGLWLGRTHAAGDTASTEGVSVVIGGMLGLLAFVMALTLASSTTRFQERRQSMLTETSAIDSAWSRARSIADPRGNEIAHLLDEYTRVRLEYVEAPPADDQLAEIEQRSTALQVQMWDIASEIAREQPNPLTVSLLNNLDDAFSAATEIRFAFGTRMMSQVFWLLIGMTLATVTGLGYQTGIRRKTQRKLSLMIIVMWTAVIANILDLGTARIGNIGHNADIYSWTLDSFNIEAASADRS